MRFNRSYFSAALLLGFFVLPSFASAQSTCPTLSLGSTGSSVTAVQKVLYNAYQGFPTPTGYFGSITQAAVKQWQSEHSIVSSGSPATTGYGAVGPKTRAAMGISCTSASATGSTASSQTTADKITALRAQLAQLLALIAQLTGRSTSSLAIQTSTSGSSAGGGGGSSAGDSTGGGTSAGGSSNDGGSTGGGGGSGGGGTTTPPPASCSFNGQTVASGASVAAYQDSSVPAGSQCISEQRTCTNGAFSGSYSNASCAARTCEPWLGQAVSGGTLQEFVNRYSCVSVAAGTYLLNADVVIPSGHTIKGAGAATTILKANPQTWKFGSADALLTHSGPTSNINISGLTLDASGIATYGIVADGMTIDGLTITNGRCSGVALNGPGIILRNSTLENNAHTTMIAGRGSFNCASVPDGMNGTYGGVELGAGIYGEGYVGNRDFAPVIENNIIRNNIGPGVDINNVDGGTFANNTVVGNSGWAGVSLYETTGWQVLNNTISHPSTEPAQPYHSACAGGPNGPRSAGIFLCSDTYGLGGGPVAPSTNNRIVGNQSASFNGILLIGAGTVGNPALSPYGNDIENNNIYGSVGPCGDNFNPAWATATLPANTWSGNNCSGTPNSPPYHF